MSEKELKDRIREIPLIERLDTCQSMIGKMCKEGRPPIMHIPVSWDDEDYFICTTIRDAIKENARLREALKPFECLYVGWPMWPPDNTEVIIHQARPGRTLHRFYVSDLKKVKQALEPGDE